MRLIIALIALISVSTCAQAGEIDLNWRNHYFLCLDTPHTQVEPYLPKQKLEAVPALPDCIAPSPSLPAEMIFIQS